MIKTPMTIVGEKQLRTELEDLKRVQRPKIVAAIAEARAHGDLKENAEYHAAKEQQGFIEGRIREIETKLSHAQVIDVSKLSNDGRVIFGATVELLNVETETTITYQIVGEDESDIKVGKISINSPIARALIGKQKDELIEVKTPKGNVEYEIINVEYL